MGDEFSRVDAPRFRPISRPTVQGIGASLSGLAAGVSVDHFGASATFMTAGVCSGGCARGLPVSHAGNRIGTAGEHVLSTVRLTCPAAFLTSGASSPEGVWGRRQQRLRCYGSGRQER
jgi:hypothetical protein